MSFNYYVIVKAGRCPTSAAVQDSLKSIDAPLDLEQAVEQRFAANHENSEISVIFEGRQVKIEARIDTAFDVDDPNSEFGDIANLIDLNFTVSEGDYVITLTFREDVDQIRAGLYLAAAMILGFDGFGFENQFESYGAAGFARRILEEAADLASWQTAF